MPDLSAFEWSMVAAAAFVAGWLLGRSSGRTDTADRNAIKIRERQDADAAYQNLSADIRQQTDDMIREGRFIEAIKLLRENARLDLRGAKLAVDQRKRLMGA